MSERVGRNDPCPCGSGKKYKNCCLEKEKPKPVMGLKGRKFTAKVISSVKPQEEEQQQVVQAQIKPVDYNELMERAFGESLRQHTDKPPVPENPEEYMVGEDRNEGNTTEMK